MIKSKLPPRSGCSLEAVEHKKNNKNNKYLKIIIIKRDHKVFFFCSFSPKILGVSLALCQKVVNTAGGIFLPGGENLRRSDFDDLKIFQG